ncbi:MAG: hypothetical protein JSW58_06530, partial [Candidatus Latescibacterota bacterium]
MKSTNSRSKSQKTVDSLTRKLVLPLLALILQGSITPSVEPAGAQTLVASNVPTGWDHNKQRTVFHNGENFFLLYTKGDGSIYYNADADNSGIWDKGETALVTDQSSSKLTFDVYLIDDYKFDLVYRKTELPNDDTKVVTCTISGQTITPDAGCIVSTTPADNVATARVPSSDRIFAVTLEGWDLRVFSADQTGDAAGVTSWTEEVPSSTEQWPTGAVTVTPYLSSDKVLVVFQLNEGGTGDGVYSRAVTRGGGPGTRVQIGDLNDIGTLSNAVCISDTDFRYILKKTVASGDSLVEYKWDDVSWSAVETIDTETDQEHPSLFLDRTSGDLYAFSIDTATDDVERHKKLNGGSWEPEVVVDAGEANTHSVPIVQMQDPPSGSLRATPVQLTWAYRVDNGGNFDLLAGNLELAAPANTPPSVVSAMSDTTVVENSPPIDNYRDLNDVFTDVEDGDSLDFSIENNSNPGLVNAVIDPDSALDLSFTPAQTGTAEIVVRATDSGALSVEDTVVVTVSSAPLKTLWRIKPDGTGDAPTIQAGIDSATVGDTVLVEAGTFTGPGNRDINFSGKAILVTSESGPEVTIIDAQGLGRCFVFNSNEDTTSVLSGLTLQNGASGQGSGIQVSDASPTISGNIIAYNNSSNLGGGMYIAFDSAPVLVGNIFIGNSALTGGAIHSNNSSPTIRNCTLVENSATANAGGIYMRNPSNPTITNTIIAFSSQGSALECDSGADPLISCSNIFGNAGGDNLCGTDGGGNISADPRFCGPPGSGDVSIYTSSPCAPANNSCGVLIGALPVACTPVVELMDTPGTVYPSVAFAGDPSLTLHIGIDNNSPLGVMLDTTCVILFSDSSNTYQATLANQTYVPGYANNFTATFSSAPVPAVLTAPAPYDLRLFLDGTDDSAAAYVDTIMTTGRNSIFVDTPKIIVSALPLQVQSVIPGERNAPLLVTNFQNGYGTSRALDSLLITNMTFGPGTSPELDSEIERLFLFDDVDSSLGLSGPDTLIAQSAFASGQALFVVGGQWQVPGLGDRALIVTADVDSLLARDSDLLDVAILSTTDVVFQGAAEIGGGFSPLFPLNSFGYVVVNGMAGHQVSSVPSPLDTLLAGSTDDLLLTLVIPQNGYEVDTLRALSIKNYTVDFSPSDLSALRVYRDNGDGSFSVSSDTNLGELVYSGDRFEISGLTEELTPPARFFIAADVDNGALNGNSLRPGIPIDGIEVASTNDGPVDYAVVSGKSFIFKNVESIQLANLPLTPDNPHPGDRDVAVLRFSVTNNTLQTVQLDTLTLENVSGGTGSQDDLDNTFSRIRIFHDNENGIVDGGDTPLADDLGFVAGTITATGLNLDFESGETKQVLVAADIDSFCSSDGDTLRLEINSPSDVGIDQAFPLFGPFPLITPAALLVDGMMAFQIPVYTSIDSLIVTNGTDILLFDFAIPANGYATDTLATLKIRNEGTATSEHLDRLALYLDGGDGVFDAGGADDTHLGDLTENPGEPGGKSFILSGLTAPLDAPCGSGTRFFVAADIAPDYSVAGTIQMAIPVLGLEVTSGNDGPIDAPVAEPSIVMIPKPDQLTAFPYPVGDQVVYPGSQQNLNFGVGFYNGYSYSLNLNRIKLYQVGTLSSTEVDSIFAYADVDTNGLFDPAIDSRIAAIGSSGASYTLDGLNLDLNPRKVSYIFISYDMPLAVTDSATFDLRLFDTDDIVVEPFGSDIDGEFPINSPGTDVVDGMIAAQISTGQVPAYNPSPNNQDILAMSAVIPANGIWPDVLDYVAIENVGTAAAGTDIASIRLWKEAGGQPTKYDPGQEDPLGYLDWGAGVWRNSARLDEPIPQTGLRVHVTFSVAATPNDGATFQARLPINGIEVASGNDGPIDEAITNPTQQTISTDPLITTFALDRQAYSTGQTITLSMMTRNEGVDTLYGVQPSVVSVVGSGGVTLTAGPDPVSADLLPGTDTTFVWTYSADNAGDISFCGFAYTADSLDVSEQTCSEIVSIQNRAVNVPVVLTSLAPPTVNQGQEDVRLFKLELDYSAGDTLSAPLHLGGLTISTEDGARSPMPPNNVLSRIIFVDSNGDDYTFTVVDSVGTPLQLENQPPIVIQPGEHLTLSVNCNIAGNAVLTPFHVGVPTLGDIDLTDVNDGTPTSMTSGNSFPWNTTNLVVNSPAESLLVSSTSGATLTANTGQVDLRVFAIDLFNPGGPNTAREFLTDLQLSFFDTTGLDVAPDAVIRKLTIKAGANTLFDDDVVSQTGNVLPVTLETPLVLSPGVPQLMDIFVDLKSAPQTSGFYIQLVNTGSIVARDINTGELVTVTADNPAVKDFPFSSDRVVFQDPASDIAASFIDQSPGVILPAMTSVPVMDLAFSHQDTISAASVEIDSLCLQFTQSDGAPVYPGDFFSALLVTHDGDTVAVETSLSSISNTAECKLNTPITLDPAGSETLSILVDSKALFTPVDIEVRIEQQQLVV